MDYDLRRLERQAAAGDYASHQQWKAALKRAGVPDPDEEALNAPLTEWEENQKDFDEIFWHAKGPKHFSWSTDCFCCHDASKWAVKLMQDHHEWGHRGWNNRNAKRKTLRTHRNSKHKARNHRLPSPRKAKRQDEPHQRRRKKRYGGRERLYGREWVWDPQAERYKVVYWCRVPDSNE